MSLLERHRAMLESESAITPDVIAERVYHSIETRAELKAAGGSPSYADHLPALGIPIYGPTGDHVYTIVRYDDPPTVAGARRKYLLPYRAQSRLDVPARSRGVLNDPAVPLYITEGSRKVDALVSVGLPAVGLTGVWSWRGRGDNGGKTVLADMEYVAWNGRTVHLIFDSDVMLKESVYLALDRFREVVKARGAQVILYYLPSAVVDGQLQKVGVDDWLAAGNRIEDLPLHATRTLRPPPGASSTHMGGGGGPEQRAQVPTPPPLAHEERILDALTEAMARLGHVGEERNAKLIFLAVTSRLLDNIVSVVVKGPSAAGKSATVERVLRFVPDDALVPLTGMSEHFLAYDERPIEHKILVLFEAVGMSGEHATYLIRTLLSEGVIRHGTVEAIDGQLTATERVRQGPAGLITTTTQVSLHPENETRLLSLTTDDSREQTRRVILSVARRDRDSKLDLDEWHTLQHWLEDGPRRVAVPFAERLAELIPPIATRLRRDVGTLLSLVQAHALVHRAGRELDDSSRVVATLEDYAEVRELVADVMSHTLGRSVSDATREAVEAVARIVEDGASHVTYADLARELKLDRSTVNRRGRVAVDGGYLRNLEDHKGKPARLVVGDPLPEDEVVLPLAEQVADGACSCAVDSEPPPTRRRADARERVAHLGRIGEQRPDNGRPWVDPGVSL